MSYIDSVNVGGTSYKIQETSYIAPSLSGTAYTATLANFTLATGATVQAKFSATNPANATLNVNSTGAKNIFYNNASITASQFKANHVYTLVYDGTQWQVVGDIDTNTTYSLSGLGGIGTITASGTAPLTLSGSKSGTTYTLTGSIADASFTTSGIVNTSTQVFGGGKTLRFTSRIYPLIGTSAERSQWYKITFPYSTITTGSSAQWFMNSFDLHFGGGYASNPSGVAHVTFYWTRAANNGAWAIGQQAALIEGILANKIGLYYRIAEPGVLYVNNTANTYNGIWIDNLYVDDTAINLNWSTITITATAAITESTSPKLSDYTKITTSYLYNDGGTLKTDSNFEGKYIKGTWLYTSAATAKTSTAKLATIESDNFIYYITPANALKSAIGTTAIGAEKTPIYWNGSSFAAGTTLKNLAYKDSLTASDIPDLSGTYVKKVTSTDNAIVRFDGTGGQIQNSGAIIDDHNNISVSSILSNSYSGYNLCKLQTSASGTEIVIKTKFKFVNSATMPSIHIHGYSYGKGAPLDLTIVYYIYSNEFYVPKVISTGGVSPDIYLFTYTENSIKYVAIGIKSSLGYLGFTVDANGGALGGLSINPDSTLCTTEWTVEHNGSNTSNTLIPAVNTDNCKLVPYLALSTTVEKAISANLTSTTNAVAYYTDTTGKFGSKASANGTLYATSANGALQWGTLPIAQGGTGKTSASEAWTALGGGASGKHADSYFALASHNHAASDINSGTFDLARIPTITNAKLANSKVTIAGNEVSLGGSLSDSTLRESLGLSNALHFIGITSTTLENGSTTATLTPKTASPSSLSKTTGFVDGDVVMDGDQLREYVWSGSAWRLLGITTSTAYTQPASTATNTWIAQVSQGTDGKITATTGSLNTSGTWSGKANTAGTADKISDLTATDQASSSATWRRVWISYANNVNGRPAYTDNLAYQTSTNTLKTPHLLTEHISGSSAEVQIKYSTTIDYWWGVGTGNENHGLYDNKAAKWILSAGAANTWTFDGNVTGNATTATTATNLSAAPTITSGGTSTISLSANTAYTLTVGGKSVVFKTPVDNNTATATDDILEGSNSGTAITYKPYATQQNKLSFDTSTTDPTLTGRLNLNGYLHATKLYSGSNEVLTIQTKSKGLSSAGWYRILDCTAYSMTFFITFYGGYNNQPPTPVTFLISHAYNTTKIEQIGRSANIGWIQQLRAVHHDTSKFYIDVYYAGNKGNTCAFEITPLDPNARSNITLIDFTIITDSITANASCETTLESHADIADNATSANYTKLYEARGTTATLNKAANYVAAGAMFHLIASSSTSATDNGKTPTDANIFQMNWDNNGGFDAQIAVSTSANRMYFRDQPSAKKAWQEVAHAQVGTSDIGSATQPVYMTSTGIITKANNMVSHLGNAGKSNMNDVGRMWPSSGMTNLTSTSNADTPKNGDTYSSGWHLYWDTCYLDNPNASNAWVAQIVNKAGTSQWWVRSRAGSTITNGTAWASSWRHLVTSTEVSVGGSTQPVYINANGEVVACTDYSSASVNYATSAGSVAWANVSGRPTDVSSFTNDAGYLTSYTETDPTVPAWAKTASKPSYTASEVGALPSSTVVTNVKISADTTTNKNYALVFGTTPSDGTTPTGEKTEGLQKNISKLYVNPSTGNIQATTFNGYTLAAASAKGVVTTIDTSANLPTSNAVKTFVEGKGYVTSSGVTSVATGVGLTGGTIIGTGTIKAYLKSETKATYDSATVTNTSGKQYAITPDKTGYLSVNVPWTDTNNAVAHALKTTTQFYITGTESDTASTGGDTFDTGIYATTVAGQLNATTYKVNEAVILQYNPTDSSLEFVF